MKPKPVHYEMPDGSYQCDPGNRVLWSGDDSTRKRPLVTCPGCVKGLDSRGATRYTSTKEGVR